MAFTPLPLGVAGFTGVAPGGTITRLDLFTNHPTLIQENMAVVKDGSANHLDLYRFGAAAQWELVTSNATHMSGNALIADSTTYSPANLWIFTTSVDVSAPQSVGKPVDVVRIYRPNTNDHQPMASSIANFKARSVTTMDERAMFFYTSEGGTDQPLRVRWTTAGWTTDAAVNFSDPGSGALDLVEFSTYGVAIRTMGNRVVCYTEDGVAFLDRTFVVTAPFRRQIVTKARGLLATHAVTDLGGGTHFGIFTDGWWLFDVGGRWTECGIFKQGHSIERRFSRQFYDILKWSARDRIVVHREPGSRGFIYIAFPTGTRSVGSDLNAPDKVWIYDPRSDTAWPDTDNYFSGTLAQTPTALGTFIEVPLAGLTIGALPGTIGSLPGTIGSFAGTVGQLRFNHGTWDGFVYQHEPLTYGRVMRDTTIIPSYYLETHPAHYGSPHKAKTIHRIGVEYRRTGDPMQVGVSVLDGRTNSSTDVINSGSFTTDGGSTDGTNIDYSTFQSRGEHLVTRIAGTHPTIFKSWEEQVTVEDGGFVKLS